MRPEHPSPTFPSAPISRREFLTASSAEGVREFGLTTMDYSKQQTPEAEAILQTGIKVTIHEAMTETTSPAWLKPLQKSRTITRCEKSICPNHLIVEKLNLQRSMKPLSAKPMKRLLHLLVILFAIGSVSRASTNSFGAWWEITSGAHGEKGAGALFILFDGDVTSHSGTGGVVTVTMIYNVDGDRYEIPGHYNRREGNIVTFEARPENLTFFSPPAWRGRLSLISGQCDGTWHNLGLHGPAPGGGRYVVKAVRGRFQSHIRPPRPN